MITLPESGSQRDATLCAQSTPESAGEDAPPETSKGVTLDESDAGHVGASRDDICDLTADATKSGEDNCLKILKRLNEIGAKSVGMIEDEDLADFFVSCNR